MRNNQWLAEIAQTPDRPAAGKNEPSPSPDPSRIPSNQLSYIHCCPVCGKTHQVNVALQSVAYGEQLTCGFECESRQRKAWRNGYDIPIMVASGQRHA